MFVTMILCVFQTGFPSPDNVGYESDWLNSFLDDPVLNDKMMSDAMNPPCIKSEHSYSINDNEPGSPNTQHEGRTLGTKSLTSIIYA